MNASKISIAEINGLNYIIPILVEEVAVLVFYPWSYVLVLLLFLLFSKFEFPDDGFYELLDIFCYC